MDVGSEIFFFCRWSPVQNRSRTSCARRGYEDTALVYGFLPLVYAFLTLVYECGIGWVWDFVCIQMSETLLELLLVCCVYALAAVLFVYVLFLVQWSFKPRNQSKETNTKTETTVTATPKTFFRLSDADPTRLTSCVLCVRTCTSTLCVRTCLYSDLLNRKIKAKKPTRKLSHCHSENFFSSKLLASYYSAVLLGGGILVYGTMYDPLLGGNRKLWTQKLWTEYCLLPCFRPENFSPAAANSCASAR
jgi:hypothetical protein